MAAASYSSPPRRPPQRSTRSYRNWRWAVIGCVMVFALDIALLFVFGIVTIITFLLPSIDVDSAVLIHLSLLVLDLVVGLIVGRVLANQGARFPMVAGVAASMTGQAALFVNLVGNIGWPVAAARAVTMIAIIGLLTRHPVPAAALQARRVA